LAIPDELIRVSKKDWNRLQEKLYDVEHLYQQSQLEELRLREMMNTKISLYRTKIKQLETQLKEMQLLLAAAANPDGETNSESDPSPSS